MGTHPIFESDFDCLTECLFGYEMEPNCRLIATDDFYAQEKRDLGFTKGQIIEFISVVDENWGRGQFNGRRGIFPLGFTKPLDDSQNNENNSVLKSTGRKGPLNSPKPPLNSPPFAQGVVLETKNEDLEIGESCLILAQNNQKDCWIKNKNGKVILVERGM